MGQRMGYFIGVLLVCLALGLSIFQLQQSGAQQSVGDNPQVEALDPETQAILEKEAELIRQMNLELEKQGQAQGQEPVQQSNEVQMSESSLNSSTKTLTEQGLKQQSEDSGNSANTSEAQGNSTQSNLTETGSGKESPQSPIEPPMGSPSLESGLTAEELITQANKQLPGEFEKLQLQYELGYSPDDFRDPFALPSSLQIASPTKAEADPFVSYEDEDEPKQISANPYVANYIKDYRVAGLLWGVKRPKALVLAPSGQMLSVYIGTRLGREGGVVWAIREKEVVFLMPDRSGDYKNGTPLILRMRN